MRHRVVLAPSTELEGVTPDEVLERLDVGDAYADLLEQTVRAIGSKAIENHRRAMARVAARAWGGDDAEIDRAVTVNDAIGSLQAVHVRVLVSIRTLEIRHGYGDSGGPVGMPALGQAAVRVGTIAVEVTTAPNLVYTLVHQLIARGLVVELTHPTPVGAPWVDMYLSEVGRRVVEELSTIEEGPSPRAAIG